MSLKRNILAAGLIAAFLLGGNCMPVSARKNNPEKTEKTSKESKGKHRKFLFFKRKSKKAEDEKPAPPSAYKQLTGRDSLAMSGVMNVISKGDTVYLELPVNLLGKPFLVSNKLQQVPAELNEASANKGINYANQMVRFEWDKKEKTVKMRQQRVTPEVPENSYRARSVADNYLDPIIASMKVEGVSPDSASVIFKVSDFFNGKKNVLNDVFNDINHNLEPDFNSMYLYYLGMIDPTLPSPDTELEEFTVTPNEAVLKELEADHEPLDNSFEIICVRTSNHVEPDEEC